MKTLFRIFNVMFFSAALVFAGFSSVFAVSPTTPPNSTVDWCALCPDGGMWDPTQEKCFDCEKASNGKAQYDPTTCACSCNDPRYVYVPGSSLGCVPSVEWCMFDCEAWGGVWDPVTHSCSGTTKCYGEDQVYDPNTCECACKDGVFNPTTRLCEPDPKLCNGNCTAPDVWNDDTQRCEPCVSVPGVSYYDPGTCQCRCTQDGYEYDAATGTCVSESSDGPIDWCDYHCNTGEMWNPNINHCEQCIKTGYNSDTCTCQCEWWQEYIPGVGCRNSWAWCEFDCNQYNGTWDPVTHSCSGSEKCYGTDQYYDKDTCECACKDGVYNPTTHQCDHEQSFCDAPCQAPDVWNVDTKSCERCLTIPGVSYYDPGSCQCRCVQEGYQYQFDEKTNTAECVPDGGGSGQTCQAGYYWEPEKQICQPCDQGFYNDTPGAASCTMCPGGRTTSDVGATTCDTICGNADGVASWVATDVCRISTCQSVYTIVNNTCVLLQSVISFDANGGTGGQSTNVTATYGQAMPAISTTAPTRTGYTFMGWFNAASGGMRYYNGDGTSAKNWDKTTDTTLYAHWTANTYTVTYSCGTGTTGTAPSNGTATYDSNFTPAANNTCAKTGYMFAGWNDGSTDWAASTAKKWTYTANKTFTAKWTENSTNTISFNANGGTGGQTESVTATYGAAMPTISTTAPTRDGYTFAGWYDNATSGTKYYNTDGTGAKNWDKTTDTTLYAHWTESVAAEFSITTTSLAAGTEFSFTMSAMGDFTVDWGDGTVETITKPDTTNTTYSHTYTTAGVYTIGMSGQATGYSTTAAISFSSNKNIAGISGSLGAIFGTLSSGTNRQPRFYNTFYNCSNLTGSIPENLFAGITGAPASSMFNSTFKGCSNLTGSIPENLFAGISGAPASGMFQWTFTGCGGLTGSIPAGLFAGISGAPFDNMFYSTFSGCSNLTGSIPENLFAGISGAPASDMFYSTFSGCSNLTGSIPENLFAGISGAPAHSMFYMTFSGCKGLTGGIPAGLFSGISGAPAIQMFRSTFDACRGLTGSIPEKLFGEFDGAPANYMFYNTFGGCSGLTGSIPENLFAGISGAPASGMFQWTFSGCSGLTGSIPEKLFAGISGAPASSMFGCTFNSCSGLTGSIPENLFAGITGIPASDMFYSTFSGCSNLTGSIPKNLFAGITNTNYASGPMSDAFYGSGLVSSCPVGYYKYTTGFEVDFSSKVACTPCPSGYTSDAGATADTGCYLVVNGGQVRDGASGTTLSTCAAGTYKTSHNEYYGTSYSCDSCADGQYQDETGKTSCKACSSLGGGLYTNSDGARNADTTCYISTTAGKYLAAKTDSTQTTCPAENYCPSAKLYYPNVNTPTVCPSATTYKRTTFPESYYAPTITDTYLDGLHHGLSSVSQCEVLTWLSSSRGQLYEYARYNTSTNKYDATKSYGWSDVNAGYYLTTKAGCGSYAYYNDIFECPAGSYCPGKARVKCNSTNKSIVHTTTFGLESCPNTYPNSAAKSESINSCYLSTSAGKYVAAAGAGQTTCAADGYCTGSVTVYYNGTGGRAACPVVNPYSPAGASDSGACGRMLHIGDNVMYLRSTQKTIPSLRFDFDNDGVADLFGNMSTSSQMMSSGVDKSFKVNYGGQVYYIHDDSAQ